MPDTALNETLQKLSASINQQAAASINSIIVPEFRGLPDEDVYKFIKRFKMATLALTDEYRCLALNKALKGAALTWAKATIKGLIIESNWSAIKTALYERFGSPYRFLAYREQLSKMEFIEGQSTLLAYVELFVVTHKKAYKERDESDVILELRLNLPDKIVGGLNGLNDKWTELKNVSDFMDLAKRYESKFMSYDIKDELNVNSLTKDTLSTMFGEFRHEINDDIRKHSESLE